jgi:TRAP transporter TAXI family solute receptor
MTRKGLVTLFMVGLIALLTFSVVNVWSAEKVKIPKMTISTGSVGAGWYTTCSSIADWTNEKLKGHPLTAVPGAGSVGNPARVTQGEADIGVSYGPLLKLAIKGKAPYEEKFPNLRAMFSLTANSHHFIVARQIEAKTLKDIVDKKIGLKMGSSFPGTSDNLVLENIFQVLGTSYKQMGKWGASVQLIGTAGRVGLWKDRHINGFHSLIEFPAAAITEAMASRPGRLLGLTEPIRDMLVKERGFVKVTIPPGTYPNQDYPVPTVQMKMVLFTTHDAPEEAIYLITKTVAESQERFRKAYGAFKYWKPEDMIKGLGIEVHKGSVKYYKERGWM